MENTRVKLLEGRPAYEPGVMIVCESVAESFEEDYNDISQLMTVRKEATYDYAFKNTGWEILSKEFHMRDSDEYIDNILYCVRPITLKIP